MGNSPTTRDVRLIAVGQLRLRIEDAVCTFLETIAEFSDPSAVDLQTIVGDLLIGEEGGLAMPPSMPELGFGDDVRGYYKREVGRFKQKLISQALERNRGSVAKAARELGVRRGYLHRLRNKYNGQAGSILVEFAMILPVFLTLTLGSGDLLWMVNQHSTLNALAHEAAAAQHDGTNACAYVAGSTSLLNPQNITCQESGTIITLTYPTHGLFGFLPAETLTAEASLIP